MYGPAHNHTDDDTGTNYGSSIVENNSVFNNFPGVDVTQTQSHADMPGHDQAWWEAAKSGITRYITPAEGGQAGVTMWQGWSTGLQSNQMRRAPLSGRVVVFPQTQILQSGPVGLDNRGRRLDSQVAQQTQAPMPDAQAIARAFVSRAGAAGIRANFMGQNGGY